MPEQEPAPLATIKTRYRRTVQPRDYETAEWEFEITRYVPDEARHEEAGKDMDAMMSYVTSKINAARNTAGQQ